jgi:hypothetical protein
MPFPLSQFPNKENNPRTALAGLTTNEFQIVVNLYVVNAARHVLLLFLFTTVPWIIGFLD